MDEMPVIDIVIVNYMSADHTARSVRAALLVASGDSVNIEVFVINNGDADASFEQTIKAIGNVVVVTNPTNVGFGAACNQGAKLGTADIILFLNPDATLQPAALKICVEAFRNPTNESLGIIGPEVTDGTGHLVRSCSRLPTLGDLFLRSVGAHSVLRNSGYPYLPLAKHDRSGDVGQVMGAALFIRRSVFQELGGFDERLFLYYEDVDLCARARTLGSKCYYLKDSRVTHFGRASSSQDTGLALALHIRSRLIYARLHFGNASRVLLTIATFLVEFPLRLFQASLGGGVVGRRGVLRAYRLLLCGSLPATKSSAFSVTPDSDSA
jgi:N-acetylglucosaminyl-diphospho-decaprenol L-rhamnosyltransferase